MRRFTLQAALGGLLLVPTPALAQDADGPSGFYVGIFAGGSLLGEQDVDTDALIIGIPVEADDNIDYDPSFRFGGYVGYQLDTNIRVQLDVSYMEADADNTIDIAGNDIESEQETTILSGTAGLFFDLWPIGVTVPYVGGGVGVAEIEVKNDNDNGGLGDSKQTVLTAFAEAGVPINLNPAFSIVPAFRFSWYNTKDKTDDIVVAAGINEAEIASIGENLIESQLLLSARFSF